MLQRARAFALNVIAWIRSPTPSIAEEKMGIGHRDSPEAVARDASIVTIHVASTPETQHLADRSFFEALPDGTIFVNTTRVAVVEEDVPAWALDQKDIRAGIDVMEAAPIIGTFDEEGDVPNCVNLAEQTRATHQITVRHRNKVGVLADALDEVRRASWNIQEISNRLFEGSKAAVASIRFDGAFDSQVVDRIESSGDIFAVSVNEI